MGLKDLFRRKRTPFEELWKQVEGITEGVKKQIYNDLSDKTKKRLEKKSPKEIEEIIDKALKKINEGAVEQIDSLIRGRDMSNRKRNWIIINLLAVTTIVITFLIINYRIDESSMRQFTLVADGAQYCYGIDSFSQEENELKIQGWFFELKSVRAVPQAVSREDSKLLLGLIPLDAAIADTKVDVSSLMTMKTWHDDRPDINDYFSCEYDYSKCGFTASIDCDDIDLPTTTYRVAVKLDSGRAQKAVLTNIYISNKGISYTDPSQSPELDTIGTELDGIVKEGVRVVSRPDVGCYIYQLKDKLYWIMDDYYEFCENEPTIIHYLMETTQNDRLPMSRLENNYLWDNIGGYFEDTEVTDQMNCGKYRVSVRDIPRDYSITRIWTGYNDNNWVWCSEFKPNYRMLLS